MKRIPIGATGYQLTIAPAAAWRIGPHERTATAEDVAIWLDVQHTPRSGVLLGLAATDAEAIAQARAVIDEVAEALRRQGRLPCD